MIRFGKKQKISNKDVDLSNDNIFSRNIVGIKSLSSDKKYTKTGIMHTGSAKDIKNAYFYNSFCDGKTCDCCGNWISPFSFDTLCEKCTERINRDFIYEKVFESNREKQEKLNKVWFLEQKI